MSTPEQPNPQPNPYGQPAPQQQPPAPGYPAPPQYGSAPNGGMPVAPQYGAPGMPVAPQYTGGPAVPPVERPASLTTAVRLMFVGAALSVVGIVLAWVTQDQLHDQVVKASRTATTRLSPSEIDTLVTVSLVIATVLGLVGVGLWIWMAFANNAGRSWARIVATVLGGLNALTTLSSVATGRESGVSTAVSVVSIVLAVVILVLLWRPASSAFYKYRSAKITMA